MANVLASIQDKLAKEILKKKAEESLGSALSAKPNTQTPEDVDPPEEDPDKNLDPKTKKKLKKGKDEAKEKAKEAKEKAKKEAKESADKAKEAGEKAAADAKAQAEQAVNNMMNGSNNMKKEVIKDIQDLGEKTGTLTTATGQFATRLALFPTSIMGSCPTGPTVTPGLVGTQIKSLKAEADTLGQVYNEAQTCATKLGILGGGATGLLSTAASIISAPMSMAKTFIQIGGGSVSNGSGGDEGGQEPVIDTPKGTTIEAKECENYIPNFIERPVEEVTADNCKSFSAINKYSTDIPKDPQPGQIPTIDPNPKHDCMNCNKCKKGINPYVEDPYKDYYLRECTNFYPDSPARPITDERFRAEHCTRFVGKEGETTKNCYKCSQYHKGVNPYWENPMYLMGGGF